MSQSNTKTTQTPAREWAGGSGRYRSIDIWRGISISLVVVSHMFFGLYGGEVTYESAMNDPLLFFFALFGTVAPFFFVIAGSSAILGMHNITERPVVAEGSIVARPVMYVALSYDHRLIDGRDSVSFLVRIRELLENPAFMTGTDHEKALLGL